MKVEHNILKHYFREANESDILFVIECMEDWPAGAHSPSQIEKAIKNTVYSNINSKISQTTKPTIENVYSIFCLSDDTPIAAFRWDYFNYQISGFKIDHLSVHPSKRNLGHYTNKIEESIVWFANQFLKADEGVYSVLLQGESPDNLNESNPVYQKSLSRIPERIDNGFSEFCRMYTKDIKLTWQEVNDSLTPQQKISYTVIF